MCGNICGDGFSCNQTTCECVSTLCEPITCERSGYECGVLEDGCGNLDFTCSGAYKYNCCRIEIEETLAQNIAYFQPDVVTLQEVVSTRMCQAIHETDPSKVCYPNYLQNEVSQARRLLGSDYTIVCDARNSYECIGVHVEFGTIEGCEPGAFCETKADTAIMPNGCDDGFSVSAVTIRVPGFGDFRLANAHLPSGPLAASCRLHQLEQLFEGNVSIPALLDINQYGLATGDFNLDPFSGSDVSVDLWHRYVGENCRFHYHSGPAEQDPRLDGGSGCDHAALWCELSLL